MRGFLYSETTVSPPSLCRSVLRANLNHHPGLNPWTETPSPTAGGREDFPGHCVKPLNQTLARLPLALGCVPRGTPSLRAESLLRKTQCGQTTGCALSHPSAQPASGILHLAPSVTSPSLHTSPVLFCSLFSRSHDPISVPLCSPFTNPGHLCLGLQCS